MIADVRSRIASGGLPENSRRALLQDVRELQYELETPRETCNSFTGALPFFADVPRFLAQTSYQNPTESTKTVHQLTFNTPLHRFDWMREHPEHYAVLNKFMAANRMAKTGIQVFPFEDKVPSLFKTGSPDTPLFVDVGGGRGQMCRAFRAKYPDLPGRVIYQDLPLTVADAPSGDGTEAMAHDFFERQPIRGAKIYFLRHVLHDWPDAKAEEILVRVVEAMHPDSVILIDEKVLPDVGASNVAAGLDLQMMCAYAASERSESAWKWLLEGRLGLRIGYMERYMEEEGDAVMLVYRE
ncbi:MAG: hypothetical protein Q9207_008564 [Kuettlingeria erythrocarpa]